jgi:uncharacterized protein DUF4383
MRKLASAQSLAGLTGIVLLVVGVVGFVPGPERHYATLTWWRTGSHAELFGVFQTSILNNLLLLGFGIAGLIAARTVASARAYLTVTGALSFGLGVYGLVIDRAGNANVVPVNRADDWLHLGIGIVLLYAGVTVSLARPQPAASS